jgi:hypothetical protein
MPDGAAQELQLSLAGFRISPSTLHDYSQPRVHQSIERLPRDAQFLLDKAEECQTSHTSSLCRLPSLPPLRTDSGILPRFVLLVLITGDSSWHAPGATES